MTEHDIDAHLSGAKPRPVTRWNPVGVVLILGPAAAISALVAWAVWGWMV